jgi:GntR family transcriptional regulator of vanillate catabolism
MPRGDSTQTVKATLGLRQLLFAGEIKPGERLVELALVERLGVSRTPLRLALMTLEHEGLVETMAGGGFAVRAFTRGDVDDAIELRGVLEGTAARFAAERLSSPRELDDIRATIELIEAVVRDETPDALVGFVPLNERFHGQLTDLAKCDVLARELARVQALPFASPSALLASQAELPGWRETLPVAQQQHRALVDAIEANDGALAESVAREHARLSRHNLDLAVEHGQLAHFPGARLLSVDAVA